MAKRVDASGRAYAGSQFQIQEYVNWHREELNDAICKEIPDLREDGAAIEWVSPLEDERFREYRDGAFLEKLRIPDLARQLAEYWPSRGPRWDALARLDRPGDDRPSGILLIEAKSYPGEMYSGGCRANEQARKKIAPALDAARSGLGASSCDWTGPLYQCANRLAHVYFLRSLAKVPAWFVTVCFVGDSHKPTSREEWTPALRTARRALGFPGDTIPFTAEVFLRARGQETHARPERPLLTIVPPYRGQQDASPCADRPSPRSAAAPSRSASLREVGRGRRRRAGS
jgi:hypothetical protein